MRESFEHDEVFYIELDLAGALGGTRQGRLDELLAALNDSVRQRIVRTQAKRSHERLYVHSRNDFAAVRPAVQAWVDHVIREARSNHEEHVAEAAARARCEREAATYLLVG
jgi:hypothetical protein